MPNLNAEKNEKQSGTAHGMSIEDVVCFSFRQLQTPILNEWSPRLYPNGADREVEERASRSRMMIKTSNRICSTT